MHKMLRLVSLVLLGLPGCLDPIVDADRERGPVQTNLPDFSVPESVHWHEASRTWFVSNIVGDTGARDGQGWITRLDEDLEILDAQWVSGLDSPAGLVSDEHTLYVADINRVHAIDIATATIPYSWTVDAADLLNDPALHCDGAIYVSDTFGNAIYELVRDQPPKLVLQNEALKGPNGVHLDGDILTIGSVGSFTDVSDEALAWRLDLNTGDLAPIPGVAGKFDGIERDGDGLLLTDFRGPLLRLGDDGSLVLLRDFVEEGLVLSTADLGFDPERRRVGIPDLLGNQVLFVDLD